MGYAEALQPIKSKGGRPVGAKQLVKVVSMFTKQEIIDFFEDLKKRSKTDSKIALYLAEQLTGKAPQALSLDVSGNVKVTFDTAFSETKLIDAKVKEGLNE